MYKRESFFEEMAFKTLIQESCEFGETRGWTVSEDSV